MNPSGVCTVVVLAASTFAGPLSPPVGPIAPTHKTMSEIEPRTPINSTYTPGDENNLFVISQPGSYYLAGNVTGQASKNGIKIAAENVTIDLEGFELVGVTSAGSAIWNGPAPAFGGATIRNGTIRNWPGSAIQFDQHLPASVACRFEHVTARDNGGGFLARGSSVIQNCIAEGNGVGFVVETNASLSNCIADSNTGEGFMVGSGGSIMNCVARLNAGPGFTCENGPGTFVGCTSSSNGGDGFGVTGSTIVGCSTAFNAGFGFRIGSRSHISGCSAFNSHRGISATNSCIVRDNNVIGATVGIEVIGFDNRIEGNNVTDATTGISVTASGNLIIRNSASGQGNRFSIVPGNATGPIVTSANVATNTIPTANFDY